MAATKACEDAGFPYGCYLVGIRDIDDIDKILNNFNILGR